MSKWPGLGDRIKERLQLMGYRRDGKPDIMRFCDEKRYRHGYFYKWANRDVTPEPENLERLAADLGVTPEWILFGPIIYERNRIPLAPAAGRRSSRGARPNPTPTDGIARQVTRKPRGARRGIMSIETRLLSWAA